MLERGPLSEVEKKSKTDGKATKRKGSSGSIICFQSS